MFSKAVIHFKKNDPLLYQLCKNSNPIILEKASDYFIRLVRSIVGQQLSVKSASKIYGRFESLFTKNINPEELLKISDEKLRSVGLSRQKIVYLKDLSQKVNDKELVLESLNNESSENVILELTKVKGIGTWSAEMFLMFGLGSEDVFSPNDLGLKNAMIKLYNLSKPTKEELLKISEKWSPYRTYASLLLWESLDNEPK